MGTLACYNSGMTDLLTSAAKIVFILMAVFAGIGFFLGMLSEANFMLLTGMAFSFYFTNKGDATTKYLGK